MLPIQPWSRGEGDEELAAIRIRPAIRHAQYSSPSVFETRMYLIFELLAVDRAAPSASAGGIASLDHEVRDYAVENDAVVVASLSECREVLACLEM